MAYDWLRAFHILFVIAWMAGLLMLPRLLVYRIEGKGEEIRQTMDLAITRLRKIILTPALIGSWSLGLVMLTMRSPEIFSEGWIHAKLALVLILTGYHGWGVALSRKVANGGVAPRPKTLRLLNELPFVLAIGIVILAVIEPWK
jgi:protoporphyrinogen IX oxidase